ncbi:hypothetical protein BV898_02603 [Hypsibius exemplaris]|uniref:Uncharacterized protein n=1 Tax=Hypsibius exemplaris TaxID=2072580 RepID=A0A1W0X7K8_HYPEX|nr:hypothetical protein BV898_02603 [Hypsibius exemplaris]
MSYRSSRRSDYLGKSSPTTASGYVPSSKRSSSGLRSTGSHINPYIPSHSVSSSYTPSGTTSDYLSRPSVYRSSSSNLSSSSPYTTTTATAGSSYRRSSHDPYANISSDLARRTSASYEPYSSSPRYSGNIYDGNYQPSSSSSSRLYEQQRRNTSTERGGARDLPPHAALERQNNERTSSAASTVKMSSESSPYRRVRSREDNVTLGDSNTPVLGNILAGKKSESDQFVPSDKTTNKTASDIGDDDTDINRETRSDTSHRGGPGNKTTPDRSHSAIPRLNSSEEEPINYLPAAVHTNNSELDNSISKVSEWQRSLAAAGAEHPDQPIPTPLPTDLPANPMIKITNFESDESDDAEDFFSTKDDLTVSRKRSASPATSPVGISFLRAGDLDGGVESPSYRTPNDGGDGTPRSSLADVDDMNLETDEEETGIPRTPSPTEEPMPRGKLDGAGKPPLPKPRVGISFLRSDSRDSKGEASRYSSFQDLRNFDGFTDEEPPAGAEPKRRMSDAGYGTSEKQRHISFLPVGDRDDATAAATDTEDPDAAAAGKRYSKQQHRSSTSEEGGRELDFISDSGLPDSDFGETVRGSSSSEDDVRVTPKSQRRKDRAGSEEESSKTLEKEGSDDDTAHEVSPSRKDSMMDWSTTDGDGKVDGQRNSDDGRTALVPGGFFSFLKRSNSLEDTVDVGGEKGGLKRQRTLSIDSLAGGLETGKTEVPKYAPISFLRTDDEESAVMKTDGGLLKSPSKTPFLSFLKFGAEDDEDKKRDGDEEDEEMPFVDAEENHSPGKLQKVPSLDFWAELGTTSDDQTTPSRTPDFLNESAPSKGKLQRDKTFDSTDDVDMEEEVTKPKSLVKDDSLDFWGELQTEEPKKPEIKRNDSNQSIDFWSTLAGDDDGKVTDSPSAGDDHGKVTDGPAAGDDDGKVTDGPSAAKLVRNESDQSIDFWSTLAPDDGETKKAEPSKPALQRDESVDFWADAAEDSEIKSAKRSSEDDSRSVWRDDSLDFWGDLEKEEGLPKARSPIPKVDSEPDFWAGQGDDRPASVEQDRLQLRDFDDDHSSRSASPYARAGRAIRPMTLPLGASKSGSDAESTEPTEERRRSPSATQGHTDAKLETERSSPPSPTIPVPKRRLSLFNKDQCGAGEPEPKNRPSPLSFLPRADSADAEMDSLAALTPNELPVTPRSPRGFDRASLPPIMRRSPSPSPKRSRGSVDSGPGTPEKPRSPSIGRGPKFFAADSTFPKDKSPTTTAATSPEEVKPPVKPLSFLQPETRTAEAPKSPSPVRPISFLRQDSADTLQSPYRRSPTPSATTEKPFSFLKRENSAEKTEQVTPTVQVSSPVRPLSFLSRNTDGSPEAAVEIVPRSPISKSPVRTPESSGFSFLPRTEEPPRSPFERARPCLPELPSPVATVEIKPRSTVQPTVQPMFQPTVQPTVQPTIQPTESLRTRASSVEAREVPTTVPRSPSSSIPSTVRQRSQSQNRADDESGGADTLQRRRRAAANQETEKSPRPDVPVPMSAKDRFLSKIQSAAVAPAPPPLLPADVAGRRRSSGLSVEGSPARRKSSGFGMDSMNEEAAAEHAAKIAASQEAARLRNLEREKREIEEQARKKKLEEERQLKLEQERLHRAEQEKLRREEAIRRREEERAREEKRRAEEQARRAEEELVRQEQERIRAAEEQKREARRQIEQEKRQREEAEKAAAEKIRKEREAARKAIEEEDRQRKQKLEEKRKAEEDRKRKEEEERQAENRRKQAEREAKQKEQEEKRRKELEAIRLKEETERQRLVAEKRRIEEQKKLFEEEERKRAEERRKRDEEERKRKEEERQRRKDEELKKYEQKFAKIGEHKKEIDETAQRNMESLQENERRKKELAGLKASERMEIEKIHRETEEEKLKMHAAKMNKQVVEDHSTALPARRQPTKPLELSPERPKQQVKEKAPSMKDKWEQKIVQETSVPAIQKAFVPPSKPTVPSPSKPVESPSKTVAPPSKPAEPSSKTLAPPSKPAEPSSKTLVPPSKPVDGPSKSVTAPSKSPLTQPVPAKVSVTADPSPQVKTVNIIKVPAKPTEEPSLYGAKTATTTKDRMPEQNYGLSDVLLPSQLPTTQPQQTQQTQQLQPPRSDGKINRSSRNSFIGGVIDIDDLLGSNKNFLSASRTHSQERGAGSRSASGTREGPGQKSARTPAQRPQDLPKASNGGPSGRSRASEQPRLVEPMSPTVPCVVLERKDYLRRRIWHQIQRCSQPNVDAFLSLPALPDPMLGSGQTYYDIFGFPSKTQYCKTHSRVSELLPIFST